MAKGKKTALEKAEKAVSIVRARFKGVTEYRIYFCAHSALVFLGSYRQRKDAEFMRDGIVTVVVKMLAGYDGKSYRQHMRDCADHASKK